MRRVIRRTLVLAAPVIALFAAVFPGGEPHAQSPIFGSRTTLQVLLCVGDPNSKEACGPKLASRRTQGGSLRRQLQRRGGGSTASQDWGRSGAKRAGWVRGPHGTCPETCSTTEVREGQTVTLTARANSGSYMKFKSWVADCEGLEFRPTCKVTVTGTTKVRAVFTQSG